MITNYGLSPSKVVRPIGSFQNLIGQLQEQDVSSRPKVCVIYMYTSSYKVKKSFVERSTLSVISLLM